MANQTFYSRGDKQLTSTSNTSALAQEFENERDALDLAFQAVRDEIDAGVKPDATAALLPGRAGGQTLNGGVAASEDLNLESTVDGTKGDVNIGLGASTDVQVGGASSRVGVLGALPVVRQPAINPIIDSTGGAVDGTLAAVPAVNGSGATTAQETAINNNFADMASKYEFLRAAMTAFGFLNIPE